MSGSKEVTYYDSHPLRVDGIMPHNLSEDEFIEWQILNGMTEEGYWESVKLGEEFVQFIIDHGRPIPTERLSPDQRGWAQADYPEHYNTNSIARWVPIEGKPGKVAPFKLRVGVHDRLYNERCSCEKPRRTFWGTRWDSARLYQCQICGEVTVKVGTNHSNHNHDSKEDSNEDSNIA